MKHLEYRMTVGTDPDVMSHSFLTSSTAPRMSNFTTMDEFYNALRDKGRPEEQIAIIKQVFKEQLMEAADLPHLTDNDFKEIGMPMGLRKAILAVLGK